LRYLGGAFREFRVPVLLAFGIAQQLDKTTAGKRSHEPKGRATGLGAMAGSDKILYPDEYEE
jgi:hypothetical protein